MKTIRRFSFVRVLLLMAAALSLSTSYAAAESSERGTFTLPTEAHWGITVLPAGTYSFTVESMGSYPTITVRSSDGKVSGMFVATAVLSMEESGKQLLTLTRRGDEMYVSSFQLSDEGVVLEYTLPKATESAAVAGLTAP